MDSEENNQKRNEDQQAHQSGVDRANQLLNKARNVRKYQKGLAGANKALKAARTVRAAATAVQAAAATWEIWIPALIIGVFVFLIITTVIIIFGGAQQTEDVVGENLCSGTCKASCELTETQDSTATSCTDSASPVCCVPKQQCADIGGTCSSQATCADVSNSQINNAGICGDPAKPNCCVPKSNIFCDPNDPDKSLKDNFNIVTTGLSSKANKYTVCRVFADASKSSKYLSLLKNSNALTIAFHSGSACSGITRSANLIDVYSGTCFTVSYLTFRKFMIHESGHVICKRNSPLCNQFSNTILASQDGTACYQYNSTNCTRSLRAGYFVKSYSLRYYCDECIWNIYDHNESFAEAITNYLLTSSGYTGHKCSITISNVKSQCVNTNKWVETNIYGGYVF